MKQVTKIEMRRRMHDMVDTMRENELNVLIRWLNLVSADAAFAHACNSAVAQGDIKNLADFSAFMDRWEVRHPITQGEGVNV